MKRFIVVVLDGYGIGAMDDVPALRPEDRGADTCKHIFERVPTLRLPTLMRLGLAEALVASHRASGITAESFPEALLRSPYACFGFHRLAHFGADTYWGHQELMGTRPIRPDIAPFSSCIVEIEAALVRAGHCVRRYCGGAGPGAPAVLVVDEALTIGDNLETDMGYNFNVTAALDLMPFERVKSIGSIVRSLARSSRVIVFGGEKIRLQNLLDAFESRDGGFAGISAPNSGVYRSGYQVVHLGFGVDPATQVPFKLSSVRVPSVFVGKVADIVENPNGILIPGVDTEEVLHRVEMEIGRLKTGFFCVNVQETDLAGHREDASLYAKSLVIADRGIARIVNRLGPDDLLVVSADHGNDPTIGHPRHTREKTPILVYGARVRSGFLGERATLADTGATVSEFFGAPPPESGISYLKEIIGISKKPVDF